VQVNYLPNFIVMKWCIVGFLLLFAGLNGKATRVYASDFGYSPADATSAFQNAILSDADTVIVDLQSGDWIVGPNRFFDLQNKVIIFQSGVVLTAKPGAFPDNGDCLINLVRANNVKIIGYGAVLKMQKAEYAALADGEWRHALAVNSSSNIEVYGLKIRDSGGDGLYVSGDTWYGTQLYSENILFRDIWCDNHYRQGISVISAQHLRVENCWFTNTKGTLPESGVDLESDSPEHRFVDIVFEKCRFTGNSGNGIQLSFWKLDSTSIPVDITFRDCYLSNNHDASNPYAAAEIQISDNGHGAVHGNARFERCMVENSQWTAVSMRKTANGIMLYFDDCVFLNVSKDNTSIYNTPIWIEVTDYSNPCPRFGGAEFNDCLITYSNNLKILGSYGEINTSPGMGNVQLNNLTVINPSASVTIDVHSGGGSPDTTCNFDIHKFTAAPSTEINISKNGNLIECSENNSLLMSTRSAENTSFPVGFSYVTTGTAQQGTDFSLMKGFMIFPAQVLTQTDTIMVLADEIPEGDENLVVTMNSSTLYGSPTGPQTIYVSDCNLTLLNENDCRNFFTVYPNPVSQMVELKFNDKYPGVIQIINIAGQVVLSQNTVGAVTTISLQKLDSGYYVIHFQSGDKHFNRKLIKL